MDLFDMAGLNPVSIVEGVINGKLEREVAKALLSTAYSAALTALWSSNKSRIATWLGLGQAERDMATSMYLSLQPMVSKGDLALTVPKELLEADNLARFQTEQKR